MDAFYLTPNSAEFRLYSTPEILQLSVKEIKFSQTFDLLSNPVVGGLHDPALGPISRQDVCGSCGQSESRCPGHFGHITLPVLLYNPVLLKQLLAILKATCMYCHRVLMQTHLAKAYQLVIMLLRKGLFVEANNASNKFLKDEANVEDLEDEMKQFAKKHVQTYDVNTKHIRALLQSTLESVSNCLKKATTRCIHCQNTNRALKFERKTTIVGAMAKKSVSSQKKKHDEKVATSKNPDKEESLPDDEIEIDGEDIKQEESNLEVGSNEAVLDTDTEIEKFTSSPFEKAVLSPYVAQLHLRKVWIQEAEFLKVIFPFLSQVTGLEAATDIFFLDVLPVAPTRFRPLNKRGDSQFEHQQTMKLSDAISQKERMLEVLDDHAKIAAKLHEHDGLPNDDLQKSLRDATGRIYAGWLKLQNIANCLFDQSLDESGVKDPFGGVKQLIEKKEGLFRSNFMGKRVNYSARSIISPDPYISTNQIGVPEVFASTLTYPQPVTPWNVHVLRQLVINGPNKYPGAFSVINENGSVLRLSENDQSQREAIANQLLVTEDDAPNRKTVCRHLLNGDYVLMNRQPTLHRPSIQAHKARVLSGIKAFRLHYSNCKAYNADFDGDEMNLHFPQDELSRSEAATLACTDFQYLVPKDGTPLAGLIQDHMVAGVTLTTRGRFFSKDDYCSLLWGAMSDTSEKLKLLPPTILKPRALWSGKQVISTILLNIIPKDQAPLNLQGGAKIPEKSWITPGLVDPKKMTPANLKAWHSNELGESTVVFRQGELLQGVLDKAHYGPSAYGLVHSCYELYGGVIAGKLLTYLGRLFATFLQMTGFSLGVGDILVQKNGDKQRKSIIKKARSVGKQAMSKALSSGHNTEMSKSEMLEGFRQAHFSKDNIKMAEIDLYVKKETDQIQDAITKSIMPVNLEKQFPSNSLQLMVQSGAKGSPVNCMQISCLLGQIELEGRRPPLMMSGRALPCFRPYDPSPVAGGFVSGRFLTGIRPTEYYFHCMAGREGLIDTAVKTSRSGYLQRCLIKHLEGIMVNYDLTVRDGDGSIMQFYYGEDGIDPVKSSYLKPAQFPFLADNMKALQHGSHSPWLSPDPSKSIKKTWRKIAKWGVQTNEERIEMVRRDGFPAFCNRLAPWENMMQDKSTLVTEGRYKGRSELTKKYCTAWYKMHESQRPKLSERKMCPDPVMSVHFPHSQPNVCSEKLHKLVNNFCKNDLNKERVDRDTFTSAINKKTIESMSDPGEAVGLLCAQSVGEPSTQMTLNTFHFAGRGEMNVTLGIPRLKEILMVGSMMPQTPQVDVPIRDIPDAMRLAEKLRAELTMVTFNQVLEYMTFNVVLVSDINGNYKEVQVKFKCLHHSQYREISNMKFADVLNYVVSNFISSVESAVKKENKILKSSSLFASGNLKRAAYMRGAESEQKKEEDPDEPNDGDSTVLKEQQRRLDTVEYEGEEEEMDEDLDMTDDEDVNTDEDDDNVNDDKESNEHAVPKISKREYKKFIDKALSYSNVSAMEFDDSDKRAFTLTFKYPPEDLQFDLQLMFNTLVKSCIVQEVKGIKQAFISKEIENGKTVLHLKTDGINVQCLFKYPYVLDLNRLYCNSIYHMWEIYGIEAANRAIIKEVQSVFGAYGITVDYHHLSLLADYMTNRGTYDAFNRFCINKTQTSMLQKITFETSMNFLLDACLNNDKDYLTSPSAQVSIGKPISVGTGAFDILLK